MSDVMGREPAVVDQRDLYIFDLDGTLADCQHRTPILAEKYDNNRWRRFYAACDKDRPVPHVIDVMERLRRFADVWICGTRLWHGSPSTRPSWRTTSKPA